jgi:putative effector of murein hydrolase
MNITIKIIWGLLAIYLAIALAKGLWDRNTDSLVGLILSVPFLIIVAWSTKNIKYSSAVVDLVGRAMVCLGYPILFLILVIFLKETSSILPMIVVSLVSIIVGFFLLFCLFIRSEIEDK